MSDIQSIQEPQTITPEVSDLGGVSDGPTFDAGALREQVLALDAEDAPDDVDTEAAEAPETTDEAADEQVEAAPDEGESPEEAPEGQPEDDGIDDAQLLEDYKAWRRGDRREDDKAFAALSRKKQEIREREVAAHHASIRAQEAYQQAQAAQQRAEAELAEFKQNPLKALERAGYSYNDLTEMVLRDGQKTSEQTKAELREELKKEMSDEFRQRQEQQAAQQRVVQFYGAVGQGVDQALATGRFPHAAKLDAGNVKNAVAGLIQDHYRQTGGRETLDFSQALGHLEAQYKDLASRFGASAPESSGQPEREPGTKNPAASKPKSLTNGANASREVKGETEVPSPGASDEEWDAWRQKQRELVAATF